MIKCIDPLIGAYITAILSRENCVRRGVYVLKDLRILKGRNVKDIVIVDNSLSNFRGQISNGIYVPSFYGDHNDKELLTIESFLKLIFDAEDVRTHVKQFAGLKGLYKKYKASQQQNFIMKSKMIVQGSYC